MAVEAVARLRKQGFRALRLDMGVVDWQAQGLPVEQGAAARAKRNESEFTR
jgi:rhodanese-related sulfurtransferase